MILDHLSVLNYKNIAQSDLTFSANVNCFLGNNGMGKTNILDAIYYLSFCKSFFSSIDTLNINHTADFFLLQGNYHNADRGVEVTCSLKRKQKKVFKRDKKEYERLSDHIGLVPSVMVSPSDSQLITGASEERRRFLDQAISQFDKNYLVSLIRYNKAVQQRNTLLKSENKVDASLLEIWELQMVQMAEIIFRARECFINAFVPVFQEFYARISQGNELVRLEYQSDMQKGSLEEQLIQSRSKDQILGHTTKGIHRDDMEMFLGEYPMKRVASQGQTKSFVIALKLALFIYLKEQGKATPILLLDDIFDKLDANRVEQIIALVSSNNFGQIFITDTNRTYLNEIIEKATQSYALFHVEHGEIKLIEQKTESNSIT